MILNQFQNPPYTKNQSSSEREFYCKDFQEAMKCAVRKVGDELLEKANKVTIGNLGDGKDHIIGVKREAQGEGNKQDNFKIRIDWDPTKGNHLNVEKGHGANREKIAYVFPVRGHEELHQLRHALKATIYDSFDDLPKRTLSQNRLSSNNEKRNALKLVDHFKSLERLTNYPSKGSLFKKQSGFENPKDQYIRDEILTESNNVISENGIEQQGQIENTSHEKVNPTSDIS